MFYCDITWYSLFKNHLNSTSMPLHRLFIKTARRLSKIHNPAKNKLNNSILTNLPCKNKAHVPVQRNHLDQSMSDIQLGKNGGVSFQDNKLVWVDLEMTGLNIETDVILEIAVLITDKDLNILAEGPDLVINHSDDVLDGMNEWCVQHHGESGLTDACKNSKINVQEAEDIVIKFLKQHVSEGKCPLAGNSVGTDKKFISKYMPQIDNHLHYRIVDVSTVKELCRRWYPDEFKVAPKKKLSHRAMDDIRESIEELRYYRSSVFK